MNGVHRQVRVSHMPLHPPDGQSPAQRAAATVLNHIAQTLSAGGFAHQTPIDIDVARFEPLHHLDGAVGDRKSTRLNSSHVAISYAVFCLKITPMRLQIPVYKLL